MALELLTKPSLLFLDEPTSGLDPGMDRSVMHMLRGLADDGRTVIVVTHSVLSLDVCDRLLVLAPGGKIAYYGPPEDALAVLRLRAVARGLRGLRDGTGTGTGPASTATSLFHRQYIADATAPAPAAGPRPPSPPRSPAAEGAELGRPARHAGPPVRGRARRRPDLPRHHDRPAVRDGRDGARPGRQQS